MEKVISTIEEKFSNVITNFENSPVKTTIKWGIYLFILKWAWGFVKKYFIGKKKKKKKNKFRY